MQERLHVLLQRVLHFGKVKVLSSATLEDVQNVETSRLKVSCSVVCTRDKDLVASSRVQRLEVIADRHKPTFKLRQSVSLSG